MDNWPCPTYASGGVGVLTSKAWKPYRGESIMDIIIHILGNHWRLTTARQRFLVFIIWFVFLAGKYDIILTI